MPVERICDYPEGGKHAQEDFTMEIKYNVTGDQRKELVKSISGIT